MQAAFEARQPFDLVLTQDACVQGETVFIKAARNHNAAFVNLLINDRGSVTKGDKSCTAALINSQDCQVRGRKTVAAWSFGSLSAMQAAQIALCERFHIVSTCNLNLA